MPPKDPRDWMWAEALDMLARTERMHRQLFQPVVGPNLPAWEPPVDLLETAEEVLIVAALPGVPESHVNVTIEGAQLVLTGERPAPAQMARVTRIHRMELPQGRFERRVPLPPGRYDAAGKQFADGCLFVTLRKVAP